MDETLHPISILWNQNFGKDFWRTPETPVGPWPFMILSSHQDLSNEGSTFIFCLLKVDHSLAQTLSNFDKLLILAYRISMILNLVLLRELPNFKNKVTHSSVLSKSWSFPLIHQLTLLWFQLNFERTEYRATVFLKWMDFRSPPPKL